MKKFIYVFMTVIAIMLVSAVEMQAQESLDKNSWGAQL